MRKSERAKWSGSPDPLLCPPTWDHCVCIMMSTAPTIFLFSFVCNQCIIKINVDHFIMFVILKKNTIITCLLCCWFSHECNMFIMQVHSHNVDIIWSLYPLCLWSRNNSRVVKCIYSSCGRREVHVTAHTMPRQFGWKYPLHFGTPMVHRCHPANVANACIRLAVYFTSVDSQVVLIERLKSVKFRVLPDKIEPTKIKHCVFIEF